MMDRSDAPPMAGVAGRPSGQVDGIDQTSIMAAPVLRRRISLAVLVAHELFR
jgi:hypothetical protein